MANNKEKKMKPFESKQFKKAPFSQSEILNDYIYSGR